MMIGQYEIGETLGEGGMGKVLLGYDTILDCKVAIKTVRRESVDSSLHGELEDRLLQEARAAAKLDHPGIVGIREFLRDGDSGYIVMKFVQGKTLDHIAPLSKAADPAFVMRVLSECAAALDHAHARGIVHRDIKPGNIMIEDQSGAAMITDFGIAKILDGRDRTEPGMILGTYQYMAPERLSASPVDGRADQFSLAIIAHRLLTGAPIYSAVTLRGLTGEILHQPPPLARSLNPAIPAAVDAVLARALAKDPSARYPDCSAFTDALSAAFGLSLQQNNVPRRGQITQIESSAQTGLPAQTAVIEDQSPRGPSKRLLIIGGLAVLTIIVIAVVLYWPRPAPVVATRNVSTSGAATSNVATSNKSADLANTLTFPSGDMVLVAGGDAKLGATASPVNLKPFYIDKTEVTNAAYLAFSRATGRAAPPGAEQASPVDPVTNVSFDDASAFAQWAKKRLPTAQEWEKAARGPSGQAYPWGSEWRDGAANLPQEATANSKLEAAYSSPLGASPYGALNMLGNVWEWVATSEQPDEVAFRALSTRFKNLRPPLSQTEPAYQTRGGSYQYWTPNRSVLLYDGLVLPARVSMEDLGFRCAKDP